MAFVVCLVTFLPFVRATVAGESFFFRDLGRYFFPLRRFAVEGLLAGELRYWNPYVHEGEAVALLPASYPLDLLHLIVPHESGFSLVLALHVPLAAAFFLALSRHLKLSWAAGAAGAFVYSLGGFSASSLSLYVHLQAMAWAPLVILTALRAAAGGRREWAAASLATAVALSTMGAEVVAQASGVAVFLAFRWRAPERVAKLAMVHTLAAGLSACTWLVVRGLIPGSERAAGFVPEVVLAFSVHPMTLLQVVVGGLYGDLSDYVNRFWGANFSPGYPYFPSLYLGAATLSVAAIGANQAARYPRRLLVTILLATVVSLGPWGGLGWAVTWLKSFRFPSKAFFSVHLAVALLTAIGLDSLERDEHVRRWRLLAGLALGCGALLAGAPLLPRIAPRIAHWFMAGFFPPAYAWDRRNRYFDFILSDAATGGLVALAVGLIALLVAARRVSPRTATVGAAALLAGDLLRTSAGLNPTVTPSFFSLSPEMSAVAARLRATGSRLFTCDPDLGPAYFLARKGMTRHDVWSSAVYLESLTPNYDMVAKVATAYSRDLTMLVPMQRVMPPLDVGCSTLPSIVEPLRLAGVSHIITLGPVALPELRLVEVVRPTRIAPLALHLYALANPLPLRAVAEVVIPVDGPLEGEALAGGAALSGGSVTVEGTSLRVTGAQGRVVSIAEGANWLHAVVEADRPTVMVVRDAYAPGWSATVNGAHAQVLRADGRHRAVEIAAGTNVVRLSYRPPELPTGVAISVMTAALVAIMWFWPRSIPSAMAESPDSGDREPA